MSKSSIPAAQLQKDYLRLRRSLAQIGYISQGSVVDRSKLRPPRSGYQWTRKVKAKTVTVALSSAQAAAFRRAIDNHRRLEKLVKEMRALSQTFLLGSIPGPPRRTPAKNIQNRP